MMIIMIMVMKRMKMMSMMMIRSLTKSRWTVFHREASHDSLHHPTCQVYVATVFRDALGCVGQRSGGFPCIAGHQNHLIQNSDGNKRHSTNGVQKLMRYFLSVR